MTNILVTTMEDTWQVLPELLGFTNPQVLDLYCFHSAVDRIAHMRSAYNIHSVDEIWVVAAMGDNADAQIRKLLAWYNLLEAPIQEGISTLQEWHDLVRISCRPGLRIFQVDGTGMLSSENECRIMREAILRIVLHAAENSSDGQLLMALAGDTILHMEMQFAASVFGCSALLLLHVNHDKMRSLELATQGVDVFLKPLPPEMKDVVTPAVFGAYRRNPLLNLSMADQLSIQTVNFPVIIPEIAQCALLKLDSEALTLSSAIGARLENSEYLLSHYTHSLLTSDSNNNFLALYSLSPTVIEKLKRTRIGVHPDKEAIEISWLDRLPKAELHCHLEGILDASDMIRVAATNHLLIDRYKMRMAFQMREWHRLIDKVGVANASQHILFKSLPDAVRDVPEPVSISSFISLFNDVPDALDAFIFGKYRSDAAFAAVGAGTYEMLGDIQGAGLLQSEAGIREACRILVEKVARHHVRYLEMRCAPIKYMRGGLNPIQVVLMIEEELGKALENFSIILTAGRQGFKAEIMQLVNVAKRIMEDPDNSCRLRGFDLIGNEATCPSKDVRRYFFPIMEKCQHVTVHAAENMDVASIWEAVYHLNAERISHGLTLRDNPALLEQFIDHNIAVEMCPSSNFQIAGFKDNFIPESGGFPEYPLKDYLDRGLRVTVNCDNPGISRTSFSRELHRAARMTPGGLSLWDILRIIRNGFKASFADRFTRSRLLREAETEIMELIQEGFPV